MGAPEMVQRFTRKRWSPIRAEVDAMKAGDVIQFPAAAAQKAYQAAAACNSAYFEGERKWLAKTQGEKAIVSCSKKDG